MHFTHRAIMSLDKIKAWYQASRPPFFIATLLPLGYGGALAAAAGGWNAHRWWIIFFASYFVHTCANLANDLFDHLAGTDAGESIGGSRVIQEGKITPRELALALILLYSLALLCGIWLLWETRLTILIPIMLFSFFSSLFYTAPPIRFGYYGFGELLVGINMGPIMVCGTYLVLVGGWDAGVLLRSIPFGIMVALVLYYQSLPDIDEDKAAGKRTIASRFNRSGDLWIFRLFVLAALGSIVALVLLGLTAPWALLSLLTLPFTFKVDSLIRTTPEWHLLHDQGKWVRLFYFTNALILIGVTYLGRG